MFVSFILVGIIGAIIGGLIGHKLQQLEDKWVDKHIH